MSKPQTTKTIFLPHNCDSVEINNSRDRVFVGMYEYEESSAARGGGFALLDVEGRVTHTHVNKEWGALDAKWGETGTNIAVASSDGIVRVFDCTDMSGPKLVADIPAVDDPSSEKTQNILMTIDARDNIMSTITAKGEIALFRDCVLHDRFQAHSPEIESWTCALSPDSKIVASGADDCALKLWDTRSKEIAIDSKKAHMMGVTCIEFLSDTDLLTGSYDDRIRKFDLRNLSQPVTEKKTIGGVWRLKPFEDRIFVAACYGGCVVVSLEGFVPITADYTEHESMAYGVDAINSTNAVSCSFYDKRVQYWQLS